jgi:hypothetical protein
VDDTNTDLSMNVRRVGPVAQDLKPNNYNLRSRDKTNNPKQVKPDQAPKADQLDKNFGAVFVAEEYIDFNLDQFFPDLNIDMADANANNNVNAAPVLNDLRGFAPPKFSGNLTENATWWLQKFEAYMARQNIVNEARLDAFILFISGPCENWFILLPPAQKDTYDHLRAAFLVRYTGNINNRADEEIFYSKYQLPHEPVQTFINDMLTIGNKIQLTEQNIVNTIKRGLLPAIRLHVLSNNVVDITNLIQQATLAESYQPLLYNRISVVDTKAPAVASTPAAPAVASAQLDELKQANSEIKTMVNNLSKMFDKMHISAVDQPSYNNNNRQNSGNQQNFSRNTHMQYNNFNRPRAPFCNFCKSQGHVYDTCRVRQQARLIGQTRPRYPLQYTQQQPQHYQQEPQQYNQRQYWGNRQRPPHPPQQVAAMGQWYPDMNAQYAPAPQQQYPYPSPIPPFPNDYLN